MPCYGCFLSGIWRSIFFGDTALNAAVIFHLGSTLEMSTFFFGTFEHYLIILKYFFDYFRQKYFSPAMKGQTPRFCVIILTFHFVEAPWAPSTSSIVNRRQRWKRRRALSPWFDWARLNSLAELRDLNAHLGGRWQHY
jgi:hypothetical protein